MEYISSKNNSFIKKIRSLEQKKYRDQLGIFLVEGEKSVFESIKLSKAYIQNLVIDEDKKHNYSSLLSEFDKIVKIVPTEVFSSISKTTTPQGILAVVKIFNLNKDFLPTKPFLVLDRIQDPGNMGTIIRSAVAAGFNEILLIDSVDPYSDKVVRSSASGILLANIVKMDTDSFIALYKKTDFEIFLAEANKQNIFDHFEIPKKYCIIIGNEGQGISNDLKKLPHISISIPMQNNMESLNAGVSASIIMYALSNKK